jgi:serine/threonine protein kinase
LRLARAGGAALDESLAVLFAVELLRSLRALHKAGFVHRDLKVGDVLMRLEDEDEDEDEGSGKGRGVATKVRGVQGRPLGA